MCHYALGELLNFVEALSLDSVPEAVKLSLMTNNRHYKELNVSFLLFTFVNPTIVSNLVRPPHTWTTLFGLYYNSS